MSFIDIDESRVLPSIGDVAFIAAFVAHEEVREAAVVGICCARMQVG